MSAVDKRILLCEPNSTSGFLFSQALAEWEYVVDLAEDARTAVDHLEGAPYPVVVISLELPVFERADLLDALRTRFPITRIMLAGNPSSPEEEAILDKLPYQRLGKPYRPSSVVTSLSAVFESISEEEWAEAKGKAEAARAAEEAARAEEETAARAAEEAARAEKEAAARAAEEAARAEEEAAARAAEEATRAEEEAARARARSAAPSPTASPLSMQGSAAASTGPPPTSALAAGHDCLQTVRSLLMIGREAQMALDTLGHRLGTLGEQGTRAERLAQSATVMIESLNAERDALQTELERLRGETQRLKAELDGLRSELETVRSRGGEATSRLEEEKRQAENGLAEVQGELTVAREQIETLRADLEEARSEAADGVKNAMAHSRELEEMNATLREQVDALKGQVEGTAETAIAQVYSTLQILFSGLPFPAIAVSQAGSVIGVSPAFCQLAGADPKALVGQAPAGKLPELLDQALQRCGEAFQAQLSLTPAGGSAALAFKALGGPIPVAKRQVRILILQSQSSLGDQEAVVLVEQFKETLFSIRIAAETLSKKAQAENVREMAAGMFQEADGLLATVDKIFGVSS